MSVLVTLSDIRSQIRSDLNVSSSSSQYPTATIDLAINRAYIKASRLLRWHQLSDAKETSTQEDVENYDFPDTWAPDSAWKLEVDGDMYGDDPDGSPMNFQDYLIWKDDNSGSTDKKWSVYGNQYFIYPVPSSAGSYNISIWGQKAVDELTNDNDETIFSSNMPECNEAIALEAVAILKKKGEDKEAGQMTSNEAAIILTTAFEKTKRDRSRYEKNQPFFYVSDMFSGKSSLKQEVIGDF